MFSDSRWLPGDHFFCNFDVLHISARQPFLILMFYIYFPKYCTWSYTRVSVLVSNGGFKLCHICKVIRFMMATWQPFFPGIFSFFTYISKSIAHRLSVPVPN